MTNLTYFPNERWKEYLDDSWVDSSMYLISNYGRIKSLKTCKEGVLVKGSKCNKYSTISGRSKKNNANVNRYLHRIVALLFIPRPDGCDFVIHKDYDLDNNSASNLKWVNKDEKATHQISNPFSEKGTNRKLTETQVIRLKRILHDPNRKTRYKIIARQFGVSEMQLYRIKSGENWGHIKNY